MSETGVSSCDRYCGDGESMTSELCNSKHKVQCIFAVTAGKPVEFTQCRGRDHAALSSTQYVLPHEGLTAAVSSFPTRWPKSALPLTVLHHRVSPVYVLASLSVHSLLYLLMTSSTPYVGYLTSVRRLTQFRRTS